VPNLTPSDEDAIFLSDVSEKDKPWDVHRLQADKVGFSYGQVGLEKYSQRIKDCSRWLQFAFFGLDDGSTSLKLFNARFCRVRLCPVCQWRRSLMWLARFFKILPQFQADYPKVQFLFLTLTVKNCQVDDLRDTVISMQKAWQKLSQRKCYPAIASIRSLEVTRGKDGSAHPHFHCILAVTPAYFGRAYLTQEKWTQLWKSCLKVDYKPIVHIQKINSNKKSTLDEAFRETLKYAVKPSDLLVDSDWLESLTKQLHKVRSISIGGIFKNYLADDEPEDLITENSGEDSSRELQADLTFGWRETYNRYLKI
jgi:plasmid rolling circle replication initiator protein Rep